MSCLLLPLCTPKCDKHVAPELCVWLHSSARRRERYAHSPRAMHARSMLRLAMAQPPLTYIYTILTASFEELGHRVFKRTNMSLLCMHMYCASNGLRFDVLCTRYRPFALEGCRIIVLGFNTLTRG